MRIFNIQQQNNYSDLRRIRLTKFKNQYFNYKESKYAQQESIFKNQRISTNQQPQKIPYLHKIQQRKYRILKKIPYKPQQINKEVLDYKGYELEKVIGYGGQGVVKKCFKDNKQWALKIIKKSMKQNARRAKKQASILQSISHENIISFKQSFQNAKQYIIVLQYFMGQTLNYYLLHHSNFLSENIAKIIFKKISSAVFYLHNINIVHRDLKLQNILIDQNMVIKIIDFGLSVKNQKFNKLSSGTINYLCPQIIDHKECLSTGVDVWALGVILFRMLSGQFPFPKSTIIKKINRNIDFSLVSKLVSRDCTDLLKKMLEKQSSQRISIKNILKHRWLIF